MTEGDRSDIVESIILQAIDAFEKVSAENTPFAEKLRSELRAGKFKDPSWLEDILRGIASISPSSGGSN